MAKPWLIAPVVAGIVVVGALPPIGREEPLASFAPARIPPKWPADSPSAAAMRDDALRRAQVWRPATSDVSDLTSNPPDPGGLLSGAVVRCRFLPKEAHGTTTKFDCVLPSGEIVKVKYGATAEIPAELAATRLLGALGFGVDRRYFVPRVRCYGCPRFPFYLTWVLDRLHARDAMARFLPQDRYTDFDSVAIERRSEVEIRTRDIEGWSWYELGSIDPALGANRADVDALRVAAKLLSHWDNKAANQRLLCLDADVHDDEPCTRTLAIIHDLGASFGPNKMDLSAWMRTPIWTDAARCTISMRHLPYRGATFPDVDITEAGRRLIVRHLETLSDPQIAALFRAAHFTDFLGARDGDPETWARALRGKIRQIADAGPCPAV